MLTSRLLPVVFGQSNAPCKEDFKPWHEKKYWAILQSEDEGLLLV